MAGESMTTGNDILSYRGNAALGFGADGTEAVKDTSNADAQVVSAFNSVIQQGMQENLQRYNQAIKDRNDTLALATQQDIDVPVLDEDRPALQAHADKVKQLLIANPDIKNNKKAYLEVQKEKAAFNSEKATAKTRQVEIMKMKQDYAANTDPEYRKALGEHIDSEMKKGVTHIPDPFLTPTKDPTFPSVPVSKTLGAVRDVNGIATRDVINETPLKDFDAAWDLKKIAPKDANEINNWYSKAITNSQWMSDGTLMPINAKIDAINARTGENRPHIADKVDGQWVPNQSPLEFAKAFNLYKDYQYNPTTEIDKDAQKALLTKAQTATQGTIQAKNKADIQKIASDISLNTAKTGTAYALADKYRADAQTAKLKGDIASYNLNQLKTKVSKSADDMLSAFYQTNEKGSFKKATDVVPNVASEAIKSGFGEIRRNAGIADDDQIADMTGNYEVTAKKMLSRANVDATGKQVAHDFPIKVYMVKGADGNINSSRVLGIYKDGSYKVANPTEALSSLVATESNFATGAEVIKQQDAAFSVIKDLQGDDEEKDEDNPDNEDDELDGSGSGINLEAIGKKINPQTAKTQPAPAPKKTGTTIKATKLMRFRKDGDGNQEVLINGKWRKLSDKNPGTREITYE